ncbi:hypothetical protein IV203_023402 [Nitzschia inconspicua]|uniref:Uncharacterized protein n=1 Tax=Nitzschia inconspicua TaxID=303405 RepID=A0A9K3KD51_9STRA|nr:hypothetical protein IV203_023402 [Nitzschia inconspicua]
MNTEVSENPKETADVPPVSTPPAAQQRRTSVSSVLSSTTAGSARSSATRRREKREKSIRTLREEIRKQLEEEETAAAASADQSSYGGRIVTQTGTRSIMSSQRIEIQAEAMVQAAIRAEEEARRNPPPAMTATQIAAYSERRGREIVANDQTTTSSLDNESLISLQAQALEHAITQSQINAGIYLGEDTVLSKPSPSTTPFPDPSLLPRTMPLGWNEAIDQQAHDPLLLSPPKTNTNEATPLLINRKLDFDSKNDASDDKNSRESGQRRSGGCPRMARIMIFFIVVSSILAMTWIAAVNGKYGKNRTPNSQLRQRWSFLRGNTPHQDKPSSLDASTTSQGEDVDHSGNFASSAPTATSRAHNDLSEFPPNLSNDETFHPSSGTTDGTRTEKGKSHQLAVPSQNFSATKKIVYAPMSITTIDQKHEDIVVPTEIPGTISPSPSVVTRDATQQPDTQIGDKNEFQGDGSSEKANRNSTSSISIKSIISSKGSDDNKSGFSSSGKPEKVTVDSAADDTIVQHDTPTALYFPPPSHSPSTLFHRKKGDTQSIYDASGSPVTANGGESTNNNIAEFSAPPSPGISTDETKSSPDEQEKPSSHPTVLASSLTSDDTVPYDEVAEDSTTTSAGKVADETKSSERENEKPSSHPSVLTPSPVSYHTSPDGYSVESSTAPRDGSGEDETKSPQGEQEKPSSHPSVLTLSPVSFHTGPHGHSAESSTATSAGSNEDEIKSSQVEQEKPSSHPSVLTTSPVSFHTGPDGHGAESSTAPSADFNEFEIKSSTVEEENSDSHPDTSASSHLSYNHDADHDYSHPKDATIPSSFQGKDTKEIASTKLATTSTPTFAPTSWPTEAPSVRPTYFPSARPTTSAPTMNPTRTPTYFPTFSPTTLSPTVSPTRLPTSFPTFYPTHATAAPTAEPTLPAIVVGPPLPPEADWFFESLLLDDQGFYFPSEVDLSIPPDFAMATGPADGVTTSSKIKSHFGTRKLGSSFRPVKIFYQFVQRSKAPNVDIEWSLDWKNHIGEAAALGEYYLTKGMDIVDSFSGGETYSKDKRKPHQKSKGSSLCAFDWERDPKRAVILGKTYAAIGEAIEDHYREAFGKRHISTRLLKKETVLNPSAATKDYTNIRETTFNWQKDWERGFLLASLFEDLASTIQSHYFDLMFGELEKTAIQNDKEELMAGLYSVQAHVIEECYQQKSRDIKAFYAEKLGREWKHLGKDSSLIGKAIDQYYRDTYRSK